MALIKCPECGKEISDKTPSCVHCGYPVTPPPKEPQALEPDSASTRAILAKPRKAERVSRAPAILGILGLLLVVVLVGLGVMYRGNRTIKVDQAVGRQHPEQGRQESQTRQQAQDEFNVSDVSFLTNGNLLVAARKLERLSAEQTWEAAQEISPTALTRSPSSSIGRLVKLSGQTYQVLEVSPSAQSSLGLNGHWTQVLMAVQNPNSLAGVSAIAFEYCGNASDIYPKTYITCAGYFVGVCAGTNAMGGAVESSVIVGNSFK